MAITSWQLIPKQQCYTKESSLNGIHSEPVFANDQKSITALPQKTDSYRRSIRS